MRDTLDAAARVLLALGIAAGLNLTTVSAEDDGAHRSCSICHLSTAGSGTGDRPDATVCVTCHTESAGSADVSSILASAMGPSGHARPFGPPAVAPGGGGTFDRIDCLSCHSAHPNDVPFQLVIRKAGLLAVELDPTSRACLGCHPDFGRTRAAGGRYARHPIGVRAGSMRTARADGVRLPLADVRGTASLSDDAIACTTCHEVHESAHPYLLRWARRDEAAACKQCHRIGRDRESLPSIARATLAR